MVSKELVAASTRPLLLSILEEGESYGYALIQRARTLSEGRLEWTDGMLYPVLHRLEREGLIVSQWKSSDNGRKRKYYRLNQSGRKALRQEQAQWQTVHETLLKLWKPRPNLT